jgi:FG-GAP-like repeat/FG-GAP repeat
MSLRSGCFNFFAVLLFALSLINLGYASVDFGSATVYPTGRTPLAVAVGDFNGDGRVDLAVATYGNPDLMDNGGFSILLGRGDGTFQPAINVAAGKNPQALAIGDFNADSRLDVALANTGSDTVTVLLGNGDGSFQAPADYETGTRPTIAGIAAADLNGDLKLDLVVASVPDFSIPHNRFGGVSVFLGNGDGTFQAPTDYVTGENRDTAVDPRAISIADFNGDYKADLALGGLFNGDGKAGPVGVLEGNADGTFQSPIVGHADGAPGLALALGDFNLDGRIDLVLRFVHAGNGTASGVALLLGNGDGTFSQGRTFNTQVTGCHSGTPFSSDVDGDGKLDQVIVAGGGPHDGVCLFVGAASVLVFKGKGDGTFDLPAIFTTTNAWDLGAVADLDGDKSPDLVTINGIIGNSDDTVSVFLNTTGADFSISASSVTPSTIIRGQSASSTISLAHLNAFDDTVTLSCSVQPAESAPTCSFSPNSLTFDANGEATATVTIDTGLTGTQFYAPPFSRRPWLLSFLFLPISGFALIARVSRRKRLKGNKQCALCLLGAMVCISLCQVACSKGGDSDGSSSNYTIAVTASSGSTHHSTNLSLSVR